MHRDVAQLGSALRSGRRGRRFKSCHPDHVEKKAFEKGLFFDIGRSVHGSRAGDRLMRMGSIGIQSVFIDR